MKLFGLFGASMLIFGISLQNHPEEKNERQIELAKGNALPTFISKDIHGKEVSSQFLKGKVLVISIAHLDQGRQQKDGHADEWQKAIDYQTAHKAEGLEVLFIASKRRVPFFFSKSFIESRARHSFGKRKCNWIVIIDWDHALKKLLGMTEDPLVFVADKQGIIRFKAQGQFVVDNEMDVLIQYLLKE